MASAKMFLEQKIDRILELLEGGAAALDAKQDADDEEDTPKKPLPRTRRGKGKAAPVAEPEHELEDIKELCVEIEADVKNGVRKVEDLCKRFGVKSLARDLDEDKYDEFYEQLQAILKGKDPGDGEEEPAATPRRRTRKAKAVEPEDEEDEEEEEPDEEDEEEEEEEEPAPRARKRRARG